MPPKKHPKSGRKSNGKAKRVRAQRPKGSNVGRFSHTADQAPGGTEDAEDNVLVWEYTVSSGISASAETIFAVKGNGIYRPGGLATFGLSQTTSPSGYARMYTQYNVAHVRSSSIQITGWATSGSITGGVPSSYQVNVPLRVVCIPVPASQATAAVASNVASLGDMTHAATVFSNNTFRLRNRGNDGLFLTGIGRDTLAELTTGDYSAAVNSDPAAPWYYVIGISNASSSLNATNYQVRIRVKYQVRWYQPIIQAVQFARDRFGNEESTPSAGGAASYGLEVRSTPAAGAGMPRPKPAEYTPTETKVPKEEKKASRGVVKLTQEEAFEDWSDADSEFAIFKQQCEAQRKAMRKLARTSTAAENYATSSTTVGSAADSTPTGAGVKAKASS